MYGDVTPSRMAAYQLNLAKMLLKELTTQLKVEDNRTGLLRFLKKNCHGDRPELFLCRYLRSFVNQITKIEMFLYHSCTISKLAPNRIGGDNDDDDEVILSPKPVTLIPCNSIDQETQTPTLLSNSL